MPDDTYVISVVDSQGAVAHYVAERRKKNNERFFVISSHGFPAFDTIEEIVRYLSLDLKAKYPDLPLLRSMCESSQFASTPAKRA